MVVGKITFYQYKFSKDIINWRKKIINLSIIWITKPNGSRSKTIEINN